MSKIHKHTYYRMSHVTGPGCTLVSLRFGIEPEGGPWVTIRATKEAVVEPMHDIDRYVEEVKLGLGEANAIRGSNVQIEEIEIIPDDYPTKGQVAFAAKMIALHYIDEAEIG